MREGVRLIVILTIVSLVAGASLAYTYQATMPRIRVNEAKARKEALGEVVPGTARFDTVTVKIALPGAGGKLEAHEVEVYRCLDGSGKVAGLAYVAQPAGFNDAIQLMVGVDPGTRRVLAVKVLDQKETPGLGAKVKEPKYTDQFKGKNLADPWLASRSGSDVQAVTGATISSKAVAGGIKAWTEAVLAAYEKEGGRA
ncbi:MAG: RnfABCDGE type electron transport complex subunit G [Chitinophagales bacterium]